MPSILNLDFDKSYELMLKYKTGFDRSTIDGPAVKYTLSDGNFLQVPPVCSDQLQSLHLDQNEPFSLRKFKGSGGQTEWDIQRIHPHRLGQSVPDKKPDAIESAARLPAKPVQQARTIAAAPTAIPVPPSLTTPQSIRLFNQLVAVLQAVKAIEEVGITIGRPVDFGAEDIRALAISGFIDEQGRGRRAA